MNNSILEKLILEYNSLQNDIAKEFISSCVVYAKSIDSNISIEQNIYNDMLQKIAFKNSRIKQMKFINYASVILTTIIIFALLFFLVKLTLTLSISLSMLYFLIDVIALYKTQDKIINKKIEKLYADNLPNEIKLQCSKLLREVQIDVK